MSESTTILPGVGAADHAERNRVLEANMGLVGKAVELVVSGMKGRPCDRDSLVQDGAIALLRAIERWREERGVKLSTYAFSSVIREIKMAATRAASEVNLVTTSVTDRNRVEKIKRKTGVEGDEAMATLGFDEHRKRRIEAVGEAMAMERSYSDTASPASGGDPFSEVDDKDEADSMLSLLDDDRSRQVVSLRFGLDGNGERKFKVIGEELGITKQRAFQIFKTGAA